MSTLTNTLAKLSEASPSSRRRLAEACRHVEEETQWRRVRTHLAKGDQAAEKAEQHYIAAALTLKALKEAHKRTWEEWEAKVKEKAGMGAPRASEIMQLADGRKTLEGLRTSEAERKRLQRERKKISSGRPEETAPKRKRTTGAMTGTPITRAACMAAPEPEPEPPTDPADIIEQCVAHVVARIQIALGNLSDDEDSRAVLFERIRSALDTLAPPSAPVRAEERAKGERVEQPELRRQ
jgi:hypothetical protein